jgi:hypothetical protein
VYIIIIIIENKSILIEESNDSWDLCKNWIVVRTSSIRISHIKLILLLTFPEPGATSGIFLIEISLRKKEIPRSLLGYRHKMYNPHKHGHLKSYRGKCPYVWSSAHQK